MELLAIGVSHNTAPASIRDALAMGQQEIASFLDRVHQIDDSIDELVALSTCNRTEIYALASDAERARRTLLHCMTAHKCVPHLSECEHFYVRNGQDAARHLFRVATGLDSLIIGEHQILGQVREALSTAEGAGTVGPLLRRLFNSAVHAGGRARSVTGIAKGTVSVALAAVQKAAEIHGDLSPHSILIVGAGKTGSLAGKLLAKEYSADLVVTNRTEDRAEKLARHIHGRVHPFDRLQDALNEADVVVAATASPVPIIRVKDVESAMSLRPGRPLVIVDVAAPRDVEPAVRDIPGVYLYDQDSLQSIVEKNREERRNEIPRAEAVLDRELVHFFDWYEEQRVKPMILALRSSFEEVGQAQASRHADRFLLTGRDRLDRFTGSLIGKLLYHPALRMRRTDSAPDLFHLSPDPAPPEPTSIRTTFEATVRSEVKRQAKHFHPNERAALERFTGSLVDELLDHPSLQAGSRTREKVGGRTA